MAYHDFIGHIGARDWRGKASDWKVRDPVRDGCRGLGMQRKEFIDIHSFPQWTARIGARLQKSQSQHFTLARFFKDANVATNQSMMFICKTHFTRNCSAIAGAQLFLQTTAENQTRNSRKTHKQIARNQHKLSGPLDCRLGPPPVLFLDSPKMLYNMFLVMFLLCFLLRCVSGWKPQRQKRTTKARLKLFCVDWASCFCSKEESIWRHLKDRIDTKRFKFTPS